MRLSLCIQSGAMVGLALAYGFVNGCIMTGQWFGYSWSMVVLLVDYG